MPKFIETQIGSSNIYVEVSENAETRDEQECGVLNKKISFENVVEDVKEAAKCVFDSFQDIGIEEIEIEYGIKLGAKGGVSFWGIAEVSSDANFSVKLKWKKNEQEV